MTIEQKKLSKSFLIYMSLFFITQLSLLLSVTYVSEIIACTAAVIWLIITIPVYCLFKKLQYFKYIYSIVNAVIAGVIISAYYTIENVKLQDSFLWGCAFLICMMINYALISITDKKKEISIINIILGIIGIAVSIYIWITSNPSLGSYMLFSIVIYMCLFISIYIKRNKQPRYIEIVNIASLMMFTGVFLIVLTEITEGGALEFLEVGSSTDTKKNKVK